MKLITIDPRALKPNPDPMRRTPATPQADALLLATIKAVGIVQPPIISPQQDGGNGYTIQYGHRRVTQAVAAELAEIDVLVADPEEDKDALRAVVENVAREAMNPVDLWRSIERLVALGWTEESIAIALAQSVRQVRKLRLLANVLPAMLDQMTRGDMPSEQQLRVIAAAGDEEQAEVWKKHKPKKGQPTVSWGEVARALTRSRMYARDASFDDDLAKAYGLVWQEDLFAPADEDSRYTTDVDAFLGAQHEWMANHLPKRGAIVEVNDWGQPKLPAKAERVYGKPGKSDCTGMYLDRSGTVQTVAYRMPKPEKKTKGSSAGDDDAAVVVAKPRPDVTRKGHEMIGDIRTDALHEALVRAPIEDDTLLALLVLAFAGQNVSIASGHADGYAKPAIHAARLLGDDGKLAFDREALQQAARGVLVDVLSCRENRSDSGVVARIAGDAIGADNFLPNMGTEDFLSCLSRIALEATCEGTSVLPRPRVKETRAALVKHFAEGRFVPPAALFAPAADAITAWAERHASADEDELETPDQASGDFDDGDAGDEIDEPAGAYAVAAE
ncbi:MAG: plasmid partitioning protein [Bradyrhizobiaceae bacterium PARB1]|nr:MAG: plasmid partitioning protein [Bradyrhizobiaceae bacterium PARB1]